MCDINEDNVEKIVNSCKESGIEAVWNFPFNPVVTEAIANGRNREDARKDSFSFETWSWLIWKMWRDMLSVRFRQDA